MKNKYLTERERYQIEALYRQGHSVKEIASALDRCKATIYNELKRGMTTLRDGSTWKDYTTYSFYFSMLPVMAKMAKITFSSCFYVFSGL